MDDFACLTLFTWRLARLVFSLPLARRFVCEGNVARARSASGWLTCGKGPCVDEVEGRETLGRRGLLCRVIWR